MSDSIEKQLIVTFCDAWGEAAPPLLGRVSSLGLLALREVSGEGLGAALAVASTWSSGFIANCFGSLPGVIICLFKSDDSNQVERLIKQPVDGLPKPGGRVLVTTTLTNAAARFSKTAPAPLSFGEVVHLDLSGQESRLATIVGDLAWVGTFSLSIGEDLDTQALMLYAPQGSMETPAHPSAPAAEAHAAPAPSAAPAASAASGASAPTASPAPAASRRSPRREEPPVRNIERLMDVELEVVVRFGVTSMPLRDVVRLGTGTMIELNRAVDEPVELLVNGRPLARGEVVVIDGYYGVRITEIGTTNERSASLISGGGQV